MATHVLSYTVLFLLWICCAAQDEKNGCGSPPRKDNEELAASSRKSSYADGDEVQYNCRPGYIKVGRIRYKCSNGEWIPASATTECRNKPCGHPGDIEFGSFELVKGTEFTFGARVQFRCNEGYKMLSRTNYRDCRVEGWSNAVPHCEVMKCFPVKPPENGRIIMTGIQDIDQDFLFGQVLRFECLGNFKLEGSEQISCGADGEWNEPVPKCVEISCKPEIIDHGYILSQKRIYKEGERVQFVCDTGYTHAERSDSRCTKNGWSSRLACIEIKCYPPQIVNGNFYPVQNLYEYEDTIQTHCEDGYQIQGGEKTSKCTENGWLPIPRCIRPGSRKFLKIPTLQIWILHHYEEMKDWQCLQQASRLTQQSAWDILQHENSTIVHTSSEQIVSSPCSTPEQNTKPATRVHIAHKHLISSTRDKDPCTIQQSPGSDSGSGLLLGT